MEYTIVICPFQISDFFEKTVGAVKISYGKLSLDLQTSLFLGIVDNFQETKPIFTDLIADNLPEINRDVVCIN